MNRNPRSRAGWLALLGTMFANVSLPPLRMNTRHTEGAFEKAEAKRDRKKARNLLWQQTNPRHL